MAPEATRVTSPSQPGPKAPAPSKLSSRNDDESQRRNQPAQRAWAGGVNPITQKFNNATHSNGVMSKGNTRSASEALSGIDKVSGDNHLPVISQALGQACTLLTKEGEIFVGILSATKQKQAETLLLLRMVRIGSESDLKSPQKSVSQKQHIGRGPEHIVVFSTSQISSIIPSGLSKTTKATAGKGFMTDSQISGNTAFRERKLVPWQAPADGALSPSSKNSVGEWDQFKVNQEKFGVKSDYDESQYTTVIDKSNPLYAMRERQAAKIAAEIEGDNKSSTFAEARGINDEGYDEEDLYSGVRRETNSLPSGQPNRYVPPSRRTQQPSPASKDMFADPAIISAQISRKDTPKDPKSPLPVESAQAVPADKDDSKASAAAAVANSKGATSSLASGSKSTTAASAQAQTQPGLGSTRVLPDVRTAFKNFANMEKLKVQDSRRIKASQDKAVKVNDLKKFAQNFKLHTPVPKDLLPILAKDELKQNDIVKRAQDQVEQHKKDKEHVEPKQPEASKRQQSVSGASGISASTTAVGSQNSVVGSPVGLTQRLENSRRLHQQRTAMPAPQASPIPTQQQKPSPVPAAGHGIASPSQQNARATPSAGEKKLSVSAAVFVPNAMAPAFKPGPSSVSSPSTKPAATRPITPNLPQPKFLREAKARDARGVKAKPMTAPLDVAKTMKPREEKQTHQNQASSKSSKDKEPNPQKLIPPFWERVDWLDNSHQGNEHLLPGYKESFASKARTLRNPSHPASPGNIPRGPHAGPYTMPNGMPGMPPMGPPNMPPQMSHQPHFVPGHYEDPHMRPPPNMQPYVMPSPRAGNAYPSPMPQGPMGYQTGYMAPGAHNMPPRQYSNGPNGMPGPHMQPPMMMPQNSSGPYMQQQPMMPMHHGSPYQVSQQMYHGPHPPNGYPSPGRAPPMMQSNSHHGHSHGPGFTPNSQYASPVYHGHHHPPHHPGQMPPRGNFNNQSHYPQSPYQQQPYPARTPSHGYVQPNQAPVTPNQGPPAQPVKSGEDSK